MIILIDTEKAFAMIQHLFSIKNPQKVKNFLHCCKRHLLKTSANITFNDGKLNIFYLDQKQECPFYIVQQAKNKRHVDWKGRSKVFIHRQYDLLCKKYDGIYKKATRTNKLVQKNYSIKDQYTNIKFIYIHQHPASRNSNLKSNTI